MDELRENSSLQVRRDEEDVLILECPSKIMPSEVKELSAFFDVWKDEAIPLCVLDFYQTLTIHDSFYRPITNFSQHLKKASRFLSSIHMRSSLEQQIRDAGLVRVFSPKKNLYLARQDAGLAVKSHRLDVGLINPFLSSLHETLSLQAQIPLQMGKIFINQNAKEIPVQVLCSVRLVEDSFDGDVSIGFELSTLQELHRLILKADPPPSTDEEIPTLLTSIASEIVNAVFAKAKKILNETGKYRIRQAIPSVFVGQEIEQKSNNLCPAISAPFMFPNGQKLWFYLSGETILESFKS